jgi:hypothetical protein
VGVDPRGSGTITFASTPSASGVVRVRRTGGLAGRTVEGEVDLASAGKRAATVCDVVRRLDLSAPTPTETFPDAFSYTFEVNGRAVTVPQQHLSDDQRALAELVLGGE